MKTMCLTPMTVDLSQDQVKVQDYCPNSQTPQIVQGSKFKTRSLSGNHTCHLSLVTYHLGKLFYTGNLTI